MGLEVTRKVRQSIVIGKVKIMLLKIEPHRIALGIEAPREISINRGEIHARIVETRKRESGDRR